MGKLIFGVGWDNNKCEKLRNQQECNDYLFYTNASWKWTRGHVLQLAWPQLFYSINYLFIFNNEWTSAVNHINRLDKFSLSCNSSRTTRDKGIRIWINWHISSYSNYNTTTLLEQFINNFDIILDILKNMVLITSIKREGKLERILLNCIISGKRELFYLTISMLLLINRCSLPYNYIIFNDFLSSIRAKL